MKKLTLILLLFTLNLASQKEKSSKMGQTTLEELKMTVYDRDSSAAAVVIYEHANHYPDRNNDEIPRTDYYYRIKILDKSSFDLADITINLYKKQLVEDISATTYNLAENGTMQTASLSDKDIFSIKEDEKWVVKKFTLPNIKEGSVIEYKYSVLSPYLSLNDWYFQSEIPKIKSEFDASILGNYKYNIKIIGYLKLDKNKPSIDKRCVYIRGIGDGGCNLYSFGMLNIPAFKEENYMLSKKNYISRISFDLKSHTSYRGVEEDLTTTWEQADKSLKKQFFNNQTSKKSFFRKNIPKAILTTENDLEKAKKVFHFIQDHYTWNKKYWTSEDVKVKNAFQEKTGDVGEINISLYNSLEAANINANLVVLSTRNNGLPTKLFPVIYDYNYVIVKVNIAEKDYYLDATDKFLPFGQVPVRTLNGEARVLDFKEKSYWTVLKPKMKTSKNVGAKLSLNEEGVFTGDLVINRKGYLASNQRKSITRKSSDDYLDDFETKNQDVEVDDYNVKNLDNYYKPLQENLKIRVEMSEALGNKIRINPFLFDRIKENPFKLKERNYPIDFAHSRKNNYYLKLEVPVAYNIVRLPKSKAFSLPNNGGRFILKTVKNGNTITVNVRLNILKSFYPANEYNALKEFYKQIIISESGYILLEKKD
tara:strand:- start:2787 stop:4736 length:1950 start_codon:yes stop_codon:yes gene_type:complete